MRQVARTPALLGTLLLSLGLAGSAAADEPVIDDGRVELADLLRKPPPLTTPWLPGDFRLAGKGITYQQHLTVGERPIRLRVQAPLSTKRVGLRFQVRF